MTEMCIIWEEKDTGLSEYRVTSLWKTLLNATTIMHHKIILDVPLSGYGFPLELITYRLSCQPNFTNKKVYRRKKLHLRIH